VSMQDQTSKAEAVMQPSHSIVYEPTNWQVDDIEHLASRIWSANWSEMG